MLQVRGKGAGMKYPLEEFFSRVLVGLARSCRVAEDLGSVPTIDYQVAHKDL